MSARANGIASALAAAKKLDDDELDGSSSDSLSGDTWISSFCSMVGHEYFAEVNDDFIDDDFNLTGLGTLVPHYRDALELISDLEPERPIKAPDVPLVEHSAELLYGLIHARFILSRQGIHAMAYKYESQHFGVCPRYFCEGTPLLPIGRHDMPGYETVRLHCPCCMDIYFPPNSRYMNIDGAFWGTSFAGLFLKSFPEIEMECIKKRQRQFELKIFGFRISEFSKSGPRMKWLRLHPSTREDVLEVQSDSYLKQQIALHRRQAESARQQQQQALEPTQEDAREEEEDESRPMEVDTNHA